jgi:hypothetical protein
MEVEPTRARRLTGRSEGTHPISLGQRSELGNGNPG